VKEEISVSDIRSLLEYLTESHAPYALAGGMAVGLWAEQTLDPAQKESLGLPVLSADIDFRGPRFLADGIKSWMDAHGLSMSQISVATRKGHESMGRIFNMPFRPLHPDAGIHAVAGVEILERLPLLDTGIDFPPNGSTVLLAGVHVLDPFSLLVCKLHAFHTRPDSERSNDLTHLRILATLLPRAAGMCRRAGIDLSADARRLAEIMAVGDYPFPAASAELNSIHEAIAIAADSEKSSP
jgi:hypothetical protein